MGYKIFARERKLEQIIILQFLRLLVYKIKSCFDCNNINFFNDYDEYV